MKQPTFVPNNTGGLDLIVERDAGNEIRILTGNQSLKFWHQLRNLSEDAIDTIEQNAINSADDDK
jgi:hypothetical protein